MAERQDRHGVAARRLASAIAVGAVVLAVGLVAGAGWSVAVTGGWSTTALVVLAWIWSSIAPMDAADTAAHARAEDFSRPTADLIVLSASIASLVAVGFILVSAGNHHRTDKALLILLAIVSVALSWLTVHTIYTLRYGDLYYGPSPGGVEFGDEPPDYRDFAYLALTIGMTFQVSDTDVTTKALRRAVTRHALISYLFGAVIVALAINTVSSLLR